MGYRQVWDETVQPSSLQMRRWNGTQSFACSKVVIAGPDCDAAPRGKQTVRVRNQSSSATASGSAPLADGCADASGDGGEGAKRKDDGEEHPNRTLRGASSWSRRDGLTSAIGQDPNHLKACSYSASGAKRQRSPAVM